MDCLSNALLYNKYVCLKVFAPSKRQYCIPHDKIPLNKDVVVFLWKKQILFCRMPHYSSWQLLHDGIPLNRHVHFKGSNFHCIM